MNNISINIVLKVIKILFKNLNSFDIGFLGKLTFELIEHINKYYNINNHDIWFLNNYLYIKSAILLLLPFIDSTKDNDTLFSQLKNLEDIISPIKIEKDIYSKERTTIIKKYCKFSNIMIEAITNNIKDSNLKQGFSIKESIEEKYKSIKIFIKNNCGKSYVNWKTIVPIKLNKYRENKLYLNTLKVFIKNIKNDDYIEDNIYMLDRSNLYYVFRNFIYRDIKKIKWTIFCENTTLDNGYYFIQKLNKYFNLDSILQFPSYYLLPDKIKNKIDNQYNNMISTEKIYYILKPIMYHIVSHNKLLIDKLTKEYNTDIFKNFELKDIEDFERIYNIDIPNNIIYESYKILNVEEFWYYMKDTLDRLKHHYFGKFLIKNNKINMKYYNYQFENNNNNIIIDNIDLRNDIINNNINLKNIYNLSKYFSFDENYEKLNPEHTYKEDTIDIFLNKCNSINNVFNINNNLRIQYKKLNVDIRKIHNDITNIFNNRTFIVNFVFEVMIYQGILSEFKFNKKLADNYFDTSTSHSKMLGTELSKVLKDYIDCNYFMTNEPYNSKYSKYFKKFLPGYGQWWNRYGIDWFSQINFFSNLYYHNINFITGATGVGKSTQVPKLYAYGFKSIFFKSNPKIIVTVPRIDPAVSNAKWVSQEMGVNIEINKIVQDNYYLQYLSSKQKHFKERCYHPTIIFSTDGSIVNKLNNNILLLNSFSRNNIDYSNVIPNENLYDAILVDEAHEHNSNMDIIISFMKIIYDKRNSNLKIIKEISNREIKKLERKIVKTSEDIIMIEKYNTVLNNIDIIKNNIFRFSIISATMDFDEPVYRAFFKNLNRDFLSYDKRVHISPPGFKTNYTIEEFYNNIDMDGNTDKKLIEQKSMEITMKALTLHKEGNLLLFSTGKAEIVSLTKLLNNILPPDTIALPYHSRMNNKYKAIIQKIDIELPKLKILKKNVADKWDETYYIDKKAPIGVYKRAVIISTNVAEASLTIPLLKIVVDIGLSKVNKFDRETETFSLNTEEISESSRLQRKGRVGRSSSGVVYYIYNKGDRENNATKYKINQESPIDNILKFVGSELDIRDLNGDLFIISPHEEYIERNIFNDIIIIDGNIVNNDNTIISKTMYNFNKNFYNILKKNLFLFEEYKKKITLKENKNNDIKTSLFYKDFSLVKNKLRLDNPDTYVYLIAKKLNIEKEMLILIPMINLLKDNIRKLGRMYKINKFKSNSDIISIYNICINFINNIGLKFFNINDDKDKYFNEFSREFKNIKDFFYNNYKKKIDKDDINKYNIFVELLHSKNKNIMINWIDKTNDSSSIYLKELKEKEKRIKNYAKKNNFNDNIFYDYYIEFTKLYFNIFSLSDDDDFDFLKDIKPINTNLSLEDKIHLCYLFGYNNNFIYKDYNNYYNFKNKKEMILADTFTKYKYDTLFYLKLNRREEANILFNCNLNHLGKFLGHIFNNVYFKNTEGDSSHINIIYYNIKRHLSVNNIMFRDKRYKLLQKYFIELNKYN